VIELRTGTPDDMAAVDAVMASAFDPRFGEAWTRSQCLGVLAMAGVWLTVASVDGVPAGFALARAIADEAELLLLAVAPSWQRIGVGAALLRATVDAAIARDLVILHLEVRRGNPAIALYQAFGFAKAGERRDYYRGRDGDTHDALTYRLTLTKKIR
jgi:ribosomal-protein-alanine N-acetyltransferase